MFSLILLAAISAPPAPPPMPALPPPVTLSVQAEPQFVSTLPRPAAIALRDAEYANEGRRFQFHPLRKAAGVRAFGGRCFGPGCGR